MRKLIFYGIEMTALFTIYTAIMIFGAWLGDAIDNKRLKEIVKAVIKRFKKFWKG